MAEPHPPSKPWTFVHLREITPGNDTDPNRKAQLIRQATEKFDVAVKRIHEGLFLKAKICFMEARAFLLVCKNQHNLAVVGETGFYIDVLLCYAFIMALDNVKDKNAEYFKNEDHRVRTTINVNVQRFPRRHFPMFLKLMYFFKRECWRECLSYCKVARTFEISPAIEIKYKTGPVFTKDLIPELDTEYCNSFINTIEEASIYGLVEQISKLKEIRKVDNLTFDGLNWIRLWSKDFHQTIIHRISKLKKPATPFALHKLFHSEILPKFYSLDDTPEGQPKAIYCYYRQEYMNDCNECIRAKLQQDSKGELRRSRRDEAAATCELNSSIMDTIEALESALVKIEQDDKEKKANLTHQSTQTETFAIIEKEDTGVQTDFPIIVREEATASKCSSSYNNGKVVALLETIKNEVSQSNLQINSNIRGELTSIFSRLTELIVQNDCKRKAEELNATKQVTESIVKLEKKMTTIKEKIHKDQFDSNDKRFLQYTKQLTASTAAIKGCIIDHMEAFGKILTGDKKKREKDRDFEMAMLREKLNNFQQEKVDLQKQFQSDLKNLARRNVFLQKVLLDQICDKYDMYKNIYNGIDKNCRFMIGNLKELQYFLTPGTDPNLQDSQSYLNRWQETLSDLKQKNDKLKELFKTARTNVIQDDDFEIGNWPETAEVPIEALKFLFDCLKRNVQAIANYYNTPFSTPMDPVHSVNMQEVHNCEGPFPLVTPPPPTAQHFTIFPKSVDFIPIHVQAPNPQANGCLLEVNSNHWHDRANFSTSFSLVPLSNERKFKRNEESSKRANDNAGGKAVENKRQRENGLVSKPSHSNQESNKENVASSGKANKTNQSPQRAARSFPKLVPYTNHWFQGQSKQPSKKGAAETATFASKLTEGTKNGAGNKVFMEDKQLYEYLKNNCQEVEDEDQLTTSICRAMKKFNGSFSNVPKDEIVKEVKSEILKAKLNAWQPINTNTEEESCPICFEAFSRKEKYALTCHHEYHKECIIQWLKTNSVCPICRIPSFVQDEFPPLVHKTSLNTSHTA